MMFLQCFLYKTDATTQLILIFEYFINNHKYDGRELEN